MVQPKKKKTKKLELDDDQQVVQSRKKKIKDLKLDDEALRGLKKKKTAVDLAVTTVTHSFQACLVLP